jgi:hypothetical protein
MIANCGKLLSLAGNEDVVLGLDLVRRGSFEVEPSRDNNLVTISIMLVCFVATIFEGDGDFRSSGYE